MAYLDGWTAHKSGMSAESNPYDEWTQAKSRQAWLSGCCDRFEACKCGGDLSLGED